MERTGLTNLIADTRGCARHALRSDTPSGPIYDRGEVTTTIRNYEALYIVDATLTDEQLEPIIAKYSAVIADQGATVQGAGKWDKRRLAYEVMGRREGIYILMYFIAESAVAKELDRVFRINDEVMRHLITRVEPEHVDLSKINQPQPTAETAAAAAPAEEATEAPAPAPVEEAVEAPVEEAAPEAEATEAEAPAEPVEESATEVAEEPAPAVEAEPEAAAEAPAEETESEESKAQE